MNKKISAIGLVSGAVIVAVVLAYSLTSIPPSNSLENNTSNEEKIITLPPPARVSEYGEPISLTQAKTVILYHIPTIDNPPAGMTLKRVTAGSLSQTFVLMYGSTEITSDMDVNDFLLKQKGLLITGEPIPAQITDKEALQAYLNAGPTTRKLVVINGIEAAGVERDPALGRASYVSIPIDHARYEIVADIPLANLIKILESMNFRAL